MSEQDHTKDAERDPRVYLAAERTFLAWIRTGLAMMGFGFVVARLGLFLRELAISQAPSAPDRFSLSLWLGVVLVLLGAVVTAAAGARHVRVKKRFDRGQVFEAPHEVWLLLLSSGLAALGIAVALYLFSRS